MKKKSFVQLITFLILSAVLTSCYEDYLVINSKFESGRINPDSTRIVFFHVLQASQPPKGISRFPDGGTHNIIYKNVSIYSYYIDEQKLEKIYDFGNLPYSSWNYNISAQSNSYVFSISPTSGWDWSVKNTTIAERYKSLSEKFMGFYKCDFVTEELNQYRYNAYDPELSPDENQIIYLKRDSLKIEIGYFNISETKNKIIKKLESNSAFIPIYWVDNELVAYKANKNLEAINLKTNDIRSIDKDLIPKSREISINKIEEFTRQFSFQDWGFVLTEYWKKNEKEYINDIIILSGNLNYRKAILQTLLPNFNKSDYEYVLNKMEKYENSLEGLERTEYEIYSTETKELIEYYLDLF